MCIRDSSLSFPEGDHDGHDDDHDEHNGTDDDHDDDHDDHHYGYVVIHIEEEGDYGFAMPTDVEFYVLMNDDHDHGHDDHDDHGDEEHDEFEVVFYHMNGCSMCESIMPEWDSFVEDNPDITTRKVESGESEASEMNIASYPTILMLDDGQMVAEFDEDYNAENLEHFYEEHAGHDEDGHDDHSDEEDDHSDEEIEFDPHSWLDPLAFKAQVDVVKDILTVNFPEAEATFNENADAYKNELSDLHNEYQILFSDGGSCAGNTVVANHNAYSYISQRYDIEFVTVHGLDPEGEPTAEDVAEVVEQIEEDGLTVLFVEEYTDESAVAGIVEQTISDTMPEGISIEILYTMELPPKNSDDTYLTLMEKNMNNLRSGLAC